MLALLHITSALVSVVATSCLYVAPSRLRLRLSLVLVGLTVVTGTWLVVATQVSMLRTCMMGLLYVGVMTIVIISARHKLAAREGVKSG